jgi:hypothetical protein
MGQVETGIPELSLEFARRHWPKYGSVSLRDEKTEDNLKYSIAAIANRIPQGQISKASRSYNKGLWRARGGRP